MDLTERTTNPNRHPWELSRIKIILNLLNQNENDLIYADIGSGDQYFTNQLTTLTKKKVFSVDPEYSTENHTNKNIICYKDISSLQNNSIDRIIMMDVLEHVKEDSLFLNEVAKKLKKSGRIIITVPAMQFLFSSHDVFLKHFRRYSKKQLTTLIKSSNLKFESAHYFYSTLFLARLFSTVLKRTFRIADKDKGIGNWQHRENSIVTKTIYHILNIDYSINNLLSKVNLYPPGLSIIATCKINAE